VLAAKEILFRLIAMLSQISME
jgi:hypothetical protein